MKKPPRTIENRSHPRIDPSRPWQGERTIELSELAADIAAATGYPKRAVIKIIQAMSDMIVLGIGTGEFDRVLINQFGSFFFRPTLRGKLRWRRFRFVPTLRVKKLIRELIRKQEMIQHAKGQGQAETRRPGH